MGFGPFFECCAKLLENELSLKFNYAILKHMVSVMRLNKKKR